MFHKFEKYILLVLLVMMGIIVLLATIELAYEVFKHLLNTDGLLLNIDELLNVLGWFLLILVALELMSSIYIFIKEKRINIEIMFLIALTAVTRKIVMLDSKPIEPMYLIGIAALVVSLASGYYLIKKSN